MMPAPAAADIEQFRATIEHRLGLRYEDGKLDYLADVLRQRMASTGSRDYGAYTQRLGALDNGLAEIRALAEQLTVNETFFFRNADNFRAFTEAVLPERMGAGCPGKRLRILSAGCASGEEPYSLAIVLRQVLPDLGAWDVKITAIDVNPAMLAKAARGRYSAWSLRATPEGIRDRYFRHDARDFVLDASLRRMVSFEERNLMDDDGSFWHSLACDVVFCRNVLMYFALDKARQVVRRLGEALVPGGFLFLGHAETLRGLSQDFHLCHSHDTFYYRRRMAADGLAEPVDWHPPPAGRGAADAIPAALAADVSWVEVIQRASDRIATLANGDAGRSARHAPGRNTPRTAAPGTQPQTAIARGWNLGHVLAAVSQERFSDALELIGSLPPDARADPDALLLQAALLTNNGRLVESQEVCRRLLAVDELNAGAHYLMALCREHAGDSHGAIEHDRTAIYLDADFAMPHLHLGLMARRVGDVAAARRDLGRALLLLAREDASRLLLFAGGFSRDALRQLCRTELHAVGGRE